MSSAETANHASRRNPWRATVLAAVAATVTVAPARAAYIGAIPTGTSTNDFLSTYMAPGARIEGWFASNVYLTDPATISIQVFGGEAGYLDGFTLGSYIYAGVTGYTIANIGASSLGSGDAIASGMYTGALAGLLDFSFIINGLPGASNGSNTGITGTPAFFVALDNNYSFDTSIDGVTAGSGSSVFLFLDDGGNHGDVDHDDLVVRLTASRGTFWVAEPASLSLLGVGLFGIALARRPRENRK